MLTLIRSVLLGVAGCAVLSISLASANEARHIATVALVEKPWAVSLDITGYNIHVDGVTPDGRRYLFATNAATSMTLSVTLEMVGGQATGQGCLAHLQQIAQGSLANNSQNVRQYEVGHMPVIEYVGPAVRGEDETNSICLPAWEKRTSTPTFTFQKQALRPETNRSCATC